MSCETSAPPEVLIGELLSKTCELHGLPALCGALVVSDEIAALGATGVSDLSTGTPATVDHGSRWYSISKPLAALTVLEAARNSSLDLDAPVSSMVPGLAFSSAQSHRHASLRDCLMHRTGLTAGNWAWEGAASDPAELVKLVAHMPCPHPPGEGFHYQNLNFVIIQQALHAVGIDWHSRLLAMLSPLGISPLARTSDFLATQRLTPHGPNGFAPAGVIADTNTDGIAPAGGLCGSIRHLASVAGMMAGRGTWRGERVVPTEVWESATAPVSRMPDPQDREREYCWRSMAGTWTTYRGHRLLTWAGGHRGYTSCVCAIPDLRIGACALGNRSLSPAPEAVCLSLLDQAAGWSPIPWPERMAATKKRLRESAAKRHQARCDEPVSALPLAQEAYVGRFTHPGYGLLVVEADGLGLLLHFRFLTLRLVPRAEGVFTAIGLDDGNEVCWDLTAETPRGEVAAWRLNPDDSKHPVRFTREKMAA